jgi:hypothetical protein
VVLKVACKKMDICWVLSPCGLEEFTDVSEVFPAPVIRVITSATSVNF